jgi:hypothetical protein
MCQRPRQKTGCARRVMATHGFRKFATTNRIRSKVDPEAREMLLRHSIGLSDPYYMQDANEILQEYLKAVDLLTINEENRLRRKVENHEREQEQWDKIRQEVDKIRQKMGLI